MEDLGLYIAILRQIAYKITPLLMLTGVMWYVCKSKSAKNSLFTCKGSFFIALVTILVIKICEIEISTLQTDLIRQHNYDLQVFKQTTVMPMGVEAKKKKIKKKKPSKSKKSDRIDYENPENRPDSIPAARYCAVCRALVKEGVKQLRHRTDEAEIFDFMSTVCNKERYYIYDYPPPEMYEGCIAFIQSWEEETEMAFLKRSSNEEVEQKL